MTECNWHNFFRIDGYPKDIEPLWLDEDDKEVKKRNRKVDKKAKKRNKKMIRKIKGVHWWADSSKAKQENVLNANIADKEINIDYEYGGRKEWLRVRSKDGIFFIGEFGKEKMPEKSGTCEFTLYENRDGYLLFGGGNIPEEDDDFDWYIKLKKRINKTVKAI